jgi:streptomycin 6-kinase
MERMLRDLVPRWQRYWPKADAEAIADDVRERLRAAAATWNLERLEPLRGGVVSLTGATADRVIKVLPRLHPEEALMRGEGIALAHWSGTGGAVPLLDTRDDGMTLLLPRLRPAALMDGIDYDEQLTEVGRLVARLHAAGPAPESLPSIEDYVEAYRPMAEPEVDELLATTEGEVAVHADLHGGNVLRDGDRWVAIDPKGVRGDPHLDVWLLLCPQAPALPERGAANELRRRIDVYCGAAGLDADRAARWLRVIARSEAVLAADSAFPSWVGRLEAAAASLA